MRAVIRMGLAALAALAPLGLAAGAGAQSLPTLQQYPLRDRIFGSGGAFFPDYVTPSERGSSFYTGVAQGKRGAIFAVGTADFNCQQTQNPTIRVLAVPPGGRVFIAPGSFVATGIDAGTTRCLGRTLRGLVVTYKGPRTPGRVSLRVTYPPRGAWFDHVVAVPAR